MSIFYINADNVDSNAVELNDSPLFRGKEESPEKMVMRTLVSRKSAAQNHSAKSIFSRQSNP